MMNLDKTIEVIKKHGAIGVLCMWLVWMNLRLNTIEEKLFDCYEDRITVSYYEPNHSVGILFGEAIVPKEITIKFF